ncbi:hypothetical protein D3C76_609920 [compost metagenome]
MRPASIQRTKSYFDWAVTRENYRSIEKKYANGVFVESSARMANTGKLQSFVGVYNSEGKPIGERFQSDVKGLSIDQVIAEGLKYGQKIGMVLRYELDKVIKSFEQYDRFIEGCGGRVKLASQSALLHIKKASDISEIDELMALFRAVCAEEEAAAALIFSLRKLRYKGSEKIQFKSHQDKQAVIVFISAVKDWYSAFHAEYIFGLEGARLYPCKVGKREAFGIHMAIQGTTKSYFIEPPLSLETKNGLQWADVIAEGINAIVAKGGFTTLSELIKVRANFRNQILYASDKSLPRWDGDVESFILNQAGMVGSLIRALGLIDPWSPPKYQHSRVVEACIEVFLKLMKPDRPIKKCACE